RTAEDWDDRRREAVKLVDEKRQVAPLVDVRVRVGGRLAEDGRDVARKIVQYEATRQAVRAVELVVDLRGPGRDVEGVGGITDEVVGSGQVGRRSVRERVERGELRAD